MENNKWIALFYFIVLRQLNTSKAFDKSEENERPEESSLVEVRAVFINCETKENALEESVEPYSDLLRFEREELFKHSVLRDCNKKLAVTVKLTCDPESSGDEYIPIEHVFEGSDKKRVRLLDPYILRLHREAPLQAYKLRRVDTIRGVIVDSSGKPYYAVHEGVGFKHQRMVRDIGLSEVSWTSDNKANLPQTIPVTPQAIHPLQFTTSSIVEAASHPSRRYVKNEMCTNITLSKRKKRNEHNIVVEETSDEGKPWDTKEQYYRISEPGEVSGLSGINSDTFDESDMTVTSHRTHHRAANINHKKATTELSGTKPLNDEITEPDERTHLKKLRHSKTVHSKEKESKVGRRKTQDKNKTSFPSLKTKGRKSHNSAGNKRVDDVDENEDGDYFEGDGSEINDGAQESTRKEQEKEKQENYERDFAVYEIGHPEFWYSINIQLFEKLSTPDGKTVWNDLTKGEQASVSSKEPEWTGQDLNVRYRPAEWIPREQYSLPKSSLCLLAPIRGADSAIYDENNANLNGVSEDRGYIVVPEEDVMGMKDEEGNKKKRNNNNTESDYNSKSQERNDQGHRRVVVRKSRTLLSGSEEKVNIAFQGSEKYLTMPHHRMHHVQIDLEARADENELVRVGASGRIAIAVADSTRKKRTILTLQVGNTGLAAARFRVVTRDCGPALTQLVNEKTKSSTMAGPVLIPPRHTRSLKLELPREIPFDMAHCSVSLVNDDEKSIAVREVAIKKGDRCFCVWHCDCVCLSDDPRLLCREMPASRQLAAGLSSRDRTRHARSACYKDEIYVNICISATGVIIALLVLGLLKAILGQIFFSIGTWGLCQLVQVPRTINQYFEADLKCRKVEYDADCWPVHPDTRERTVRMYSRSMEFVLNVIFFVSVPCLVAYNAVKHICGRFRKSKKDASGGAVTMNNTNNKCFSTHDMQAMAMRWRRRHAGLRRWMTPQAQELSKELWNKGLLPAVQCEFMRPLLREGKHAEPQEPDPGEPNAHDPCVDSEQEDTDYVLAQMQKSRESLSILKQQNSKESTKTTIN